MQVGLGPFCGNRFFYRFARNCGYLSVLRCLASEHPPIFGRWDNAIFSRTLIESTAELVHATVAPTPQYAWPQLCEAVGCPIWVKHENHTPTGAFKVRGGLVYLAELMKQNQRPEGLITATRGNHGQSIPFAARPHGVPVTVLVPNGNSREKNAAMVGWGARLEVFGDDFDDARGEAERRAADENLQMVPSYHEHLILGVATYAWELFHSVPDLDTVYVPIGMGSGVSGLIGVRDLLGITTEIVGVVSDAADAVARSVEAGRLVETESANTFVDGVACRVPHPDALAVISRGVERLVRVSDEEVAEAMRLLFRTTHNVAEPAGAAAMAALYKERRHMAGERVAVILTGGNVDRDVFRPVLAGITPRC